MTGQVVDTFAGPGGWDEGMRMLGLTDVVGIEWDQHACATAEAAGHRRVQADVAALDPLGWPCWGKVSSPPCQAWSMAGKRKGELDRSNCHILADRMAAGDDSTDWCDWEDERSALVCQPVRWVRDLRPEWIALEEVPAVASLWEHFARIFRGWGYSVWTGDLCAADYGVPQTRTRRILIASRVRKVGPPPPTHSENAHGGDLFGGHTQPWVTMAEALGWGFDEPSATVSAEEPAPTLTANTRLWKFAPRPDEPAPTALFGHQPNDVRWITGQARDSGPCAEREPRGVDEPSYTIRANGSGSNPSGTKWVTARPATTVVGSFRPDVIAGPGHHSTSRQDAPGSVRVTVQEAAILQSFRADYEWTGGRTKQYQQVGNAIPPRLAAHVVAAAIGVDPTAGIAAYYSDALGGAA